MMHTQFICTLALALLASFAAAQERISIEDFKAGLDSGAYDVVLDVRTLEERQSGFIPGSIHVPMDDNLEENDFLNTLVAASSCQKCATIVATCSVGGRAASAVQMLRDMGFEGTIINGQGTRQWVAAGYELVFGEGDENEPLCVTTDICPNNEEEIPETSTKDTSMEEGSTEDTPMENTFFEDTSMEDAFMEDASTEDTKPTNMDAEILASNGSSASSGTGAKDVVAATTLVLAIPSILALV